MDSSVRSAPRVSIVIPTYNIAAYLAITLDSVLAQTFSDIEVILFDDGSKDDTLRIAEEYAARDARVKVLRGNHGGTVAARNSGFAASDPRSEFVTFFDHDDVWEKDALETLLRALEAHPEAPAAHGLCRCIDSNGDPYPDDILAEDMRQRVAVVGERVVPIPTTAPTSFGALLVKNYITTPGVSLVRRSALQKVGLYEQSIAPCDDWDMNLRLARLGDLAFVDRILLNWRRHAAANSLVSKGWRHAYHATRQRTIHAPENTPAQKKAALLALRGEILEMQRDALRMLRGGAVRTAGKRLARSVLLGAIWLGVSLPGRT